jgi:hypothetical protein
MDKWPTYLRVLDARDCGASYLDIAQVVLGINDDEKPREASWAAREALRQAEALRDNWGFVSEDQDDFPLGWDDLYPPP